MTSKAQSQNITNLQRGCVIGFFALFILSGGLVTYASLGGHVLNEDTWSTMFKGMAGAMVGYLFGANMKEVKKDQ